MWFRPFEQNLKKNDFWPDKAFKQISGRKGPFRKNTWVIISKGREISHKIQNQSRKVRPLLRDGYYPFTYIQGFFTARNKRWNSKEIQSHRYHRENSGFLTPRDRISMGGRSLNQIYFILQKRWTLFTVFFTPGGCPESNPSHWSFHSFWTC